MNDGHDLPKIRAALKNSIPAFFALMTLIASTSLICALMQVASFTASAYPTCNAIGGLTIDAD